MSAFSTGLAEALARNEIDVNWVAGIRKGWKLQADRARGFKGRIGKASKINLDALHASSRSASAALDDLVGYVRALRADLFVNKGFFPVKDSGLAAERVKVSKELDAAEDALRDARDRVEFWSKVLTPGSSENRMDGGSRYAEAHKSVSNFQLYVNGVEETADQAIKAADQAISGRLLRHLAKLATKAGGKLEMPAGEPDKVSLGKVAVLFADANSAGARFKNRTWLATGVDMDGMSVAQTEPRPPTGRGRYLDSLKQAEALLKQRGLGYLWYGNIFVMCRDCGGPNSYGSQYTTGAHYHRKGDYITIYDDPHPRLAKLVAHEMGHRYYYKFMTASDRGRFDSFFKQITPVSAYGGEATEEDFAEVFAWYIDGRDLKRDQLERFKAFLGRKLRSESASSSLEVLL